MSSFLKQYEKLEQQEQKQMRNVSYYCHMLNQLYFEQEKNHLNSLSIQLRTTLLVQKEILGYNFPLYLLHHIFHLHTIPLEKLDDILNFVDISYFQLKNHQFSFMYQNQFYQLIDFSFFSLSKSLQEKLHEDSIAFTEIQSKYQAKRNCHTLASILSKEVDGEVYIGYLQFPQMKMLHSWCVKGNTVYDTMYQFVLSWNLYEKIVSPIDMIAISNKDLNQEYKNEDGIVVPYPIYLYCNYLNDIGEK